MEKANDLILILLVLALAGISYLTYRLARLERLLANDPRFRRRLSPQRGKVVSILKDDIEPGPFKPDGPKR